MSLLLLVSLSIVVLAEPRALDPKGSKQVVIDEQTAGVIKAKPPVPQVFYVLPRAVLSQGSPEAPAQLAPRIIEAVKAEPF
jgi:hypothetical protein